MRTLKEIQKDKDEIWHKIHAMEETLREIEKEEYDRLFYDFCEKHGLQAGDVVEITNSQPLRAIAEIVQVVGFDRYGVVVRKIKKNGEPYANTYSFCSQSVFDGCKVIDHKPIEDNE